MLTPRSRVLDGFPTPIAYTYSLIFDEGRDASVRRWALCYCEYQVLRCVALPMVGQYLRADLGGIDFARDKSAEAAVKALNAGIAGIRAPFFSDWIALVEILRRRLPALGLRPILPDLDRSSEALKGRQAHEFALPNQPELDPLRAILALRNATAHGATPDESAAARHLEAYLPVLHRVLDAFDALAGCRLLVFEPNGPGLDSGSALVRELRGVRPGPATVLDDLTDELIGAFGESPAVLVAPDGRAEPLYPLLNPQPMGRPDDARETIFLYDGHGRLSTKGETVQKDHIHYLGVHHRVLDSPACSRMKELLSLRRIDFFLPKEKVAPWTIAETAADYSRNLTLAEMRGTKYLPECYVPFPELERHFDAFLAARPPRSGFVLAGLSGNGKSAFLAHRVARLLEPPGPAESLQDRDDRDNPNLVFFLRGGGIARREDGVSLYRDVAEKLGLSTRPGDGIATFGELLEHLDARWKQDRVEGRRLILIIDGLNEAPEPKLVLKQALETIRLASRFPWCKVAVSTRLEWLDVWAHKGEAHETSDLERARSFLYYDDTRDRPGQPAPPTIGLDPFDPDQAAEVYARYQSNARSGVDRSIPACRTPWSNLGGTTQALLANPLYLHLFMETFDGRLAEPVTTVPNLFRRYVDRALQERPNLRSSIESVIGHIRSDPTRPSADLDDDDVNAIRESWAKTLTVEERSIRLHPVEDLAHEGWVHKRVREEGGGYRFRFQAIAEYLVYSELLKAKPDGEGELSYWARRIVPGPVFPEYAGAFSFLLRDWADRGLLGFAAKILEASAEWFGEILEGFLVDQATIGHVPGRPIPHAESAARMLGRSGAGRTAATLINVGYLIVHTPMSQAAGLYLRAGLSICDALRENGTDAGDLDMLRANGLNMLGYISSNKGRLDEAETAFIQSSQIFDHLKDANPDAIQYKIGLAHSLHSLGKAQRSAGKSLEAGITLSRALELSRSLHKSNPRSIAIELAVCQSLSSLFVQLTEKKQAAESRSILLECIAICEESWAVSPGDVGMGIMLTNSLSNLGIVLGRDGRLDKSDIFHRRSIQICESTWQANPQNVIVGLRLAQALSKFRNMTWPTGAPGLRYADDVETKEDAFDDLRRSIRILETLWREDPGHVQVCLQLGETLRLYAFHIKIHLGDMIEKVQQYEQFDEDHYETYGYIGMHASDELQAYRRSVEILESISAIGRENVDVRKELYKSLCFLGASLSLNGETEEGGAFLRRAHTLNLRGEFEVGFY